MRGLITTGKKLDVTGGVISILISKSQNSIARGSRACMILLQGTFISLSSTSSLFKSYTPTSWDFFMPVAFLQKAIFLPATFSLGDLTLPKAFIHGSTSLSRILTSFNLTLELWLHVSKCCWISLGCPKQILKYHV